MFLFSSWQRLGWCLIAFVLLRESSGKPFKNDTSCSAGGSTRTGDGETDVGDGEEVISLFSLLQISQSLAHDASAPSADPDIREDGMTQAQTLHFTGYDRYPEIFSALKSLLNPIEGVSHSLKILSFGCSDGAEVRTLRSYFQDVHIDGVDIDGDLIAENAANNTDSMVRYYNDTIGLVPNSYDAVLAMNVLMRHDRSVSDAMNARMRLNYTDFVSVMDTMDGLVRPGGYLVIYNAQYLVSDYPRGIGYQNMAVGCMTDVPTAYHMDFPTADHLYNKDYEAFLPESFVNSSLARSPACSLTNELCLEGGWLAKYDSTGEMIQKDLSGCSFPGVHHRKLAN